MILALSTTFFILSTLSVVPFYLLMLVAPNGHRTRRVMGSLWPVIVPVAVYAIFVVLILVIARPDVLGLWQELYIGKGLFSTSTVEFLSDMYGRFAEFAVLHGWAHILVGDMFMARWAYLDAVERAVKPWVVALIVALIGFMGPIGVLVYLAIRGRNKRTSADA